MKKIIFISVVIIIISLFAVFNGSIEVYAAKSKFEGHLLLDVQRHGEAYYIFQGKKYYLGRPQQVFEIMKKLSLGISESDFQKSFIQVNDVNKIYRVTNKIIYPYISGRIVIRPQAKGEAYYVSLDLISTNGYSAEYLGRPDNAFQIMSRYGEGTTSAIIDSIPTGVL